MNLAEVAKVSDQKAKTQLYKDALAQLWQNPSEPDCKAFVDHMLLPDVPLVISRSVLHTFVANLDKLPDACRQSIATYALEKMQEREVSFDEQLTQLREFVAALLEQQQDWSSAAKVLSDIDLERSTKDWTEKDKLERYIKVTMLYLEDDDAVNAERFFFKANPFIAACDDAFLEMKYKACYARISDSKRRFLEAAMRYYELSQLTNEQSEESIAELLRAACTCAILHPASTHRSRMLAMLYKDERIAAPGAVPQFPFLEKMLMERLITKDEVQAFDSMLRDHQRAQLPDGFTVLEAAVVQHNIRSVSKMYHNIALPELASLLGLSVAKAESLACDMISEGRLKGYIDQVDDVIYFEDDEGPLATWDNQITNMCETINSIMEDVGAPA